MAYVSNPKELDPNAPVQLSGAGTAPTGGSAGASTVNRAPSASSGGGFTNVQAYLNSAANRQQGARMGQNLAADVTREVGEANEAINQGVNQFNTAADQNTVGYDEGQVDQTISTGAANPYTTRALAGTYTGPTGLNRAAIDKETSEAAGRANQLQSQGGRAEYLRELTGRNQSAGVSRLNNAFVNTNADAISAINAGASGARGLGDQVTAAETAAGARAAAARDTNAATRGRVAGKIDSYLDTQEGDIEARTVARRSEAQARQHAAANYLRSLSGIQRARTGGSGGLVQTDTPEGRMRALNAPVPAPVAQPPLQSGFEAAGLTEDQARSLQGIVESNNTIGADRLDLNSYYTPGDIANINSAQSLDPQEAARLNALAALTGRRGFTSAPQVDVNGNFSFENALAALQSNSNSALNRFAESGIVGPPGQIRSEAQVPAPIRSAAPSAPAAGSTPVDNVVDLITTPRRTVPRTRDRAMEMADGGLIEGPGGPRDDVVPINASNGEYVIPTHVVEKLGKDFFDKMLSTYKR